MKRLRTAGSKWRVLVHGDRDEHGMFNTSHHIGSHERRREDTEHSRSHEFPGTELDEVVIGQWAHIEMMDTNFWWMSISGVVLHVKADRDGRPKRVTVHMPGVWDEPVPGCEYQLNEQSWEVTV